MSWTTNKVNSIDKNKKVDGINPKKIILGKVRESQFLYISYKFDYTVSSWFAMMFLSWFLDTFSMESLLYYIVPFWWS